MTGFSPAWLALREPADHRARNSGIADLVGRQFSDAESVSVCDLGAGTGSSLRALAASLPAEQHWTLLDHDPALLAAARRQLTAWADQVEQDATGGALRLMRGDRCIRLDLLQADLREDLDTLVPVAVDLINGSALIDLVSDAWLDLLVAAAARRNAAVLMTLSYTGTETWAPQHPADEEILAAFNAHQQGIKDFGPALGPRAAEALSEKLAQEGYEVALGPSPWRLEAGRDSTLMVQLAEGIAAAVRETGRVPEPMVGEWLRARCTARSAEVGHTDLFAHPR